jgi:hypothetical protein
MEKVLTVLQDQMAEFYMPPAVYNTLDAAKRTFAANVNSGQKESFLCTHPEHFTMFHIGYFNERTGVVDLLPAPARS